MNNCSTIYNVRHFPFRNYKLCSTFAGAVRLQSHRPNVPEPVSVTTATPSTTTFTSTNTKRDKSTKQTSNVPTMTTECSNVSVNAAADTARSQTENKLKNQSGGSTISTVTSDNNTLMQIITNRQYQNYATALTITIGVSCFLLLLNFFIFAGIYRQRESTSRTRTKCKKKSELSKLNDDHNLIENKFLDPMLIHYNEPSTSYVSTDHDISLKRFDTTAQVTNTKSTSTECSPTHLPVDYENESYATDDSPSIKVSPSIPEPPPPPKNLPPTCYQNVMKPSTSSHTLPTTKKRVQIQEISV